MQVLDEQTQIERVLLAFQLEVLHISLEPGLSVLNWHSLTMQDFVGSVRRVCGPSVQLISSGSRIPSHPDMNNAYVDILQLFMLRAGTGSL